jgi:hypothetical protein
MNYESFVFISSRMGILGSGSLSAYDAGITFQDALAMHLVAQVHGAFTIDLGGYPRCRELVRAYTSDRWCATSRQAHIDTRIWSLHSARCIR